MSARFRLHVHARSNVRFSNICVTSALVKGHDLQGKQAACPDTEREAWHKQIHSHCVCRDYVAFEFLANAGRFTRHVEAAATVANGKLILFTIGSSAKRWSKMKEKLDTAVRSFKAFDVYS
jgi:hypothetical protein